MTLQLTNRSDQPVRLQFLTTQRYDVTMHDVQGHEIWRWSADRIFAQVVREETLKPRRSLTYHARAPGRFAPGRYTTTGIVSAADRRISASVQITIH